MGVEGRWVGFADAAGVPVVSATATSPYDASNK